MVNLFIHSVDTFKCLLVARSGYKDGPDFCSILRLGGGFSV